MSALARSVIILLIFNLFVVAPLQAKVRKCVLSNGHVIFTDIACPEKAIPAGQKRVKKKADPFAGMSKAQQTAAITKRDKKWALASKSACLTDIDTFAKTLQSNFSEIIAKSQHKLVTRSHNQEITEYVHRVSFFFMADGTEWESSGNCHAVLTKNSWKTNFQRITTGIPFISARKDTPKNTDKNETVVKTSKKSKTKVTASNSPK